ncbi:MAG: type II toxin-antitoxin system Phd/YefM family antitoxin [Opitutae bacterium]|jgi:PHD/YefM family antitoxin component YafN of YafNO toxin-antitoxin module|nr:type II toxin-antitoxin system Phd/YefM family antitoxin [Opitutae bacterium]
MDSIKSWIAQGNLPALIDKTNQTAEPILICSGNCNAILVAEREWKEMQEKIRKHDYLKSVEKNPIQFQAKDPHQMDWQQTRDESYFPE